MLAFYWISILKYHKNYFQPIYFLKLFLNKNIVNQNIHYAVLNLSFQIILLPA